MAAKAALFLAEVDRVLASALALEDLRTARQAEAQVLAAGKEGPAVRFPPPESAEPAPRRLSLFSADRGLILDLVDRDGGTQIRITSAGAALARWAGQAATLVFAAADLSVPVRFSEAGIAEADVAVPLAGLAGAVSLLSG